MTKVYPTKASALNVKHPTAGAPKIEGTEWPYDSFTCRRLTDGSFTEDASKAYRPPAEKSVTQATDVMQAKPLEPTLEGKSK
jgi:hypothetical protein